MNARLSKIHKDFQQALTKAKSTKSLEELKVTFLGKKGHLTQSLQSIKDLPASDRPAFGQEVNQLRDQLESELAEKKQKLVDQEIQDSIEKSSIDVGLPGYQAQQGHLHPLSQTEHKLVKIFSSLGFSVEEGPDVETDHYNFEALNFPPNHPARDMQDSFFVESGHVLRTHTSPVQVRFMEKKAPPIRIISPGRVYRHDSDTTHSPVFHQVEGLCVGPNITFAHLKGTLEAFVEMMFGPKTPIRFRPSFFPFTEPSAEIDVMGPNGQWMEILGCGMVDPNVFEDIAKTWSEKHPDMDAAQNPYNPEKISGFAFGMGIERIAMIQYGIKDIRLFFENDTRFLRQF